MGPDRSWTITVDRDRCMATGNCCVVAPGTFDVGDDDFAFVVDAHGDTDDHIRAAVDRCPSAALTIVEAPT